MISDIQPQEKKIKTQDLFRQLSTLNTQKNILNTSINSIFSELKTLGFSRSVVNKYLKKSSEEIAKEDMIEAEFASMIGE